MAGGTTTGNVHVIENRGIERRGVVTIVTILRGGHMVKCRIFPGCIHTVVATLAIRGYTLVIINTTGKGIDVMTDAAILCGGYMCCRFTGGIDTVVAACTITRDTKVTEDRWTKRSSSMANVTVLGSRYMIGRRILTRRI